MLRGAELDRLTRLGALLLLGSTALVNLAVLTRGPSAQEKADGKLVDRDEEAAPVRKTQGLASANLWSALICLIAAGFYVELNGQRMGLSISTVRNLDWLITCPLLALEMSALLGASLADPDAIVAAAASAVMVLIGWGERVDACRLLLGFGALGIVTTSLRSLARRKRSTERNRGLVAFFFSLWLLYGLVAVLRSADVITGVSAATSFNVLDCGSKALFGMAIAYLALGTT